MTTSTMTGSGGAGSRYPIRTHTDADFDLAGLLAAADQRPRPQAREGQRAAPLAGVAEAAAKARLWRLPDPGTAPSTEALPGGTPTPAVALPAGQVAPVDVALLHSFETSPTLRPPVAERTTALSPVIARDWLTLAAHWIGVTAASGDLRFFNAACKLLGAVSIHHQAVAGSALSGQIGAVARLVEIATSDLAAQLANRLPPSSSPPLHDETPQAGGPVTVRLNRHQGQRPRIVVLAGAGSGSPARLAAMTAAAGLQLTAMCWYAAPTLDGTPSGYADAWYPPEQPPADQFTAPALQVPQISAATWDQVADALDEHDADLVILAGMPIVPAAVLTRARLGVINAHNGALPTYRGMDAVAWAILNNDPVICTLHLAEPGVDTGGVLATTAVPVTPAGTLRARVKTAQLQMLAAAAVHITATGALPAATAQPAGLGRQFYRLHPHLKRILDASPYATIPDHHAGRTQP
ncbi:formyltransferase family protein [Nonomuraea sp. NPDC052265]|uniref:formyltransferase family protein n=1 Tax=Nonomuraea sp. NPDC052265 TaxID=3364374 RepID=UPI0037C8C813